MHEPEKRSQPHRAEAVLKSGHVLDARGAARLLGAHVETVRRLARRQELPAYKVGKDWRFTRSALERWAGNHDARPAAPVVLAVDDDSRFLYTIRRVLRREGYDVRQARCGAEALELARRHEPQLALIDLSMPGMSGVALIEALRLLYPSVPVVVMTGYPDGELMAQALRAGPLTLLAKPVQSDVLIDTVRRGVQGGC